VADVAVLTRHHDDACAVVAKDIADDTGMHTSLHGETIPSTADVVVCQECVTGECDSDISAVSDLVVGNAIAVPIPELDRITPHRFLLTVGADTVAADIGVRDKFHINAVAHIF